MLESQFLFYKTYAEQLQWRESEFEPTLQFELIVNMLDELILFYIDFWSDKTTGQWAPVLKNMIIKGTRSERLSWVRCLPEREQYESAEKGKSNENTPNNKRKGGMTGY